MELNEHLQKVFEHAKQMELDGKALYLEEMEKTEDPGLKRILKMLADAEENHYEIFDALQRKNLVDVKPTSLVEIKNIFTEIKDSGKSIVTTTDHAEFYKKVQKIEEQAEAEYRKEAELAEDEKLKEIFTHIANEEHRHATLMEGFYQMCLNPTQWVEDAEFNHFGDY